MPAVGTEEDSEAIIVERKRDWSDDLMEWMSCVLEQNIKNYKRTSTHVIKPY